MTSWTLVDQVNVCEKPPKGEEITFKVEFDPNLEPCYNAIHEGVPRDALGLIVASMNKASIWRTKEVTSERTFGAGSSREFYLAAELKGHRGLVRDVAWASGSIRGFDVVATACKDGFVRVFQVSTPPSRERERGGRDFSKVPDSSKAGSGPDSGEMKAMENGEKGKNAPSGIGAGLAGTRSNRSHQQEAQGRDGAVAHFVKEVSKLNANKTPVWRVKFDDDGQLLGSTGDDGKLMLWRREPSGVWSKSSELGLNRTEI